MKNLDLILKRILVVSLSISVVLLCASLFIFAIRMENGKKYDSIVISSNTILIWNTQTGTFKIGSNVGEGTTSTEKFW